MVDYTVGRQQICPHYLKKMLMVITREKSFAVIAVLNKVCCTVTVQFCCNVLVEFIAENFDWEPISVKGGPKDKHSDITYRMYQLKYIIVLGLIAVASGAKICIGKMY